MDNLDIQMMIYTFLDSIVMMLNFLIPVVLPDGTQIGSWIFFGFIGLLLVVIGGIFIKRKYD